MSINRSRCLLHNCIKFSRCLFIHTYLHKIISVRTATNLPTTKNNLCKQHKFDSNTYCSYSYFSNVQDSYRMD